MFGAVGDGVGDRSLRDGGSACLFEDVEEDANESCFCWFNVEIIFWISWSRIVMYFCVCGCC